MMEKKITSTKIGITLKPITDNNMNKIITAIAMCLVSIAATAQEKADILISYECVSPNKMMKPVTTKMWLLVSPTEAMWFNNLSLWVD